MRLKLDFLAIAGISLTIHVRLAMMVMHVIQTEAYVTNIFRAHDREVAHSDEYAGMNLALVDTETLLVAIVFFFAADPRVISQLGYEMHGAKVRSKKHTPVYYISDFDPQNIHIG